MTTCRFHCAACGAHFTSLRAFDAHRQGPWDDRRCEFPDELIERTGVCKLSGPVPRVGVTVLEHPSAEDIRRAA